MGRAGFYSPYPALRWARTRYFSGNSRPAPLQGPPTLFPWTGRALFATLYFKQEPVWSMSRALVWAGTGPENAEKDTLPQALEWDGTGKRTVGPHFSMPYVPPNKLQEKAWPLMLYSCPPNPKLFTGYISGMRVTAHLGATWIMPRNYLWVYLDLEVIA